MLAVRILDLKEFMNKLLIGDMFDHFCLVEATITTFNTFSIDGKIKKEFFDSDECEILNKSRREYSRWKDVKSWCLSVIRGRKTPLSFKIIFQLSPHQTELFMKELHGSYAPGLIRGLYMNLQYKNKELLLTSGISYQTFLPDKTPEQLWENNLQNFLKSQEILFEVL